MNKIIRFALLFVVLTVGIVSTGQQRYKMEKLTPREALIEMMKMNHLKQADIAHIFGPRGVTSEVINGKREISKANAKKLAAFFITSTDLFL
jgi:HTH-type transcriptional regulator / antitoxin HigA